MQAKSNSGSKKTIGILIALVILLLISLGSLGYMYYDLNNQNKALQANLSETSTEKESVTRELEDLLAQYESLETDNEGIRTELDQEKARIVELLDEIKKVKKNNYRQINQYKAELETLRKIMKGYIVQIDSLNTLATTYKNKYTEVKSDYEVSKKTITELSNEKDSLSTQVKRASELIATNIVPLAINDKSKPVTKQKKMDKLKVCFTIRENKVTKSGTRFVYIRVSRPDGLVIINDPTNMFSFEGNEIAYTERREVEYANEDVDVCIYWQKNQELIPGTYNVDIFADGKQIGISSFELK